MWCHFEQHQAKKSLFRKFEACQSGLSEKFALVGKHLQTTIGLLWLLNR